LVSSSVVIHNLHIVCVSIAPGKADPPAVVDPNAVLPGTVAPQRFEPVAANRADVGQAGGRIQPPQPLARLLLDPAELSAAVVRRA